MMALVMLFLIGVMIGTLHQPRHQTVRGAKKTTSHYTAARVVMGLFCARRRLRWFGSQLGQLNACYIYQSWFSSKNDSRRDNVYVESS
jgi:hypothetical protein